MFPGFVCSRKCENMGHNTVPLHEKRSRCVSQAEHLSGRTSCRLCTVVAWALLLLHAVSPVPGFFLFQVVLTGQQIKLITAEMTNFRI